MEFAVGVNFLMNLRYITPAQYGKKLEALIEKLLLEEAAIFLNTCTGIPGRTLAQVKPASFGSGLFAFYLRFLKNARNTHVNRN
jgi:hypothetical protein